MIDQASVILWLGRLAPGVLGGGAGYAYYRFVGCRSGACPITRNPWISTMYGALMGFMIFHSFLT